MTTPTDVTPHHHTITPYQHELGVAQNVFLIRKVSVSQLNLSIIESYIKIYFLTIDLEYGQMASGVSGCDNIHGSGSGCEYNEI